MVTRLERRETLRSNADAVAARSGAAAELGARSKLVRLLCGCKKEAEEGCSTTWSEGVSSTVHRFNYLVGRGFDCV